MAYDNIDDVLDQSMRLPIGGKVYEIPPVDAETGLLLQKIAGISILAQGKGHREPTDDELESLQLDDAGEKLHMSKVLGSAYDEMVADGVDWERMKFVLQTATIRALGDNAAAEQFWNSGGAVRPKVKAPADRKPGAKKARQGSGGSKSPKKPKQAAQA